MRPSGVCVCGAKLLDENRIDTKYVRCGSCGSKIQMYKKQHRVFSVQFVTSQYIDRGVFHESLRLAGVQNIQLYQIRDTRTSTAVSGVMEYDVRGGWSMDIRRKVAKALRTAGVYTTANQIHVQQLVRDKAVL